MDVKDNSTKNLLASENLVSIITNESTITLLSLKGWAKG
jgi:hypothetical protein